MTGRIEHQHEQSEPNQTNERAKRKQRDTKTRELSRLPFFNQPYEQDITGDRNQTLESEYNNPRNVEGGQELRRKTGNPDNRKPEQTKEETLHDFAGPICVLRIDDEKSDINWESR